MKKRFSYLILPIITLILEILLYGAVCNFAISPSERYRETFSYFDLTPFGYANFAPFITAIITCIIIVLLLIYCVTNKHKIAIAVRNILCVCAILSLCPLMFGVDYFSVVAVFITISIVAELLLLHLIVTKKYNKS